MPLSNINSVMAEAVSGKVTRRLYFQDELPTGSTDSTSEPGPTIMHIDFKLGLFGDTDSSKLWS